MSWARDRILAFCEAVVPSVKGEDVFELVTQGRQAPGYSACADLGHAALYEIGARSPLLVNRAAPPLRFTYGVNVNRLYDGARKVGVWRDYDAWRVPQPADIVIIGDSTKKEEPHVLLFRSLEETEHAGTWWRSYDFGQVRDEDGAPCSTICNRQRVGRTLGGRTILGWVDIDLVTERLVLTP